MTRRSLPLLAGSLALVGLVVAGCGSSTATTAPTAAAASSAAPTSAAVASAAPTAAATAAASPAPTSAPTAAATAAPSIAVPSVAVPSIAIPSIAIPSIPLPSGSFEIPSFSLPSQDKDLEARLPNQINGTTLTKFSWKGGDFIAQGSTNSQDLTDLLTALGKTPNDMSVAFASDSTGTLDVQIGAFRVNGADTNGLLNGFLAATKKESPESQFTQANVGGKNVTAITDPTDESGSTAYVYANGDILFYVLARDATLAGAALTAMP